MSQFQFAKTERLKSRKSIAELFNSGRSIHIYPVKILYISRQEENKQTPPIKCGVSVAKKKHKKAVKRNLLKRRLREAYRLNKQEIQSIAREKNISLNIFIIYIAEDIESYTRIKNSILAGLRRIETEILKG